jgi:hypothetical protein
MTAHSPRLSDIAARMPGEAAACYKRIQRFLQETDPQEALRLLFNEAADFVIGDPTEIERPHARKTKYVGTLMDGQTQGFWLLTLATPLRGRAIPFHFLTLFVPHLRRATFFPKPGALQGHSSDPPTDRQPSACV